MSVAIEYPVDALVSFHYYGADSDMAALVNTGRVRVIGDSGAFSALTQGARIDLDAYATWVHRWREHLYWAASLDVIGDPAASYRNWQLLRDRHQLATVPTLHAGADTTWLDAYAAEGVDFIGLGGMAGVGQAPRAYRWAVNMFRHARAKHPAVRFHLWGVTNRTFLDSLPAYSADSSGAIGQAYRYGSLRLFDPASGKHLSVMLRGRNVYRVGSLLRRVYGVDPAEIETSHSGNRVTLVQIAVAVTQQYALWLQRRHGHVSAPSWGLNAAPAAAGPRIHSAMATGGRKQGDEAIIGAAPEGPLVHVVAGTGHKQSNGQDIHAAVDGPRVHLVDTSQDQVGRGLNLREVTGATVKPGPIGVRKASGPRAAAGKRRKT